MNKKQTMIKLLALSMLALLPISIHAQQFFGVQGRIGTNANAILEIVRFNVDSTDVIHSVQTAPINVTGANIRGAQFAGGYFHVIYAVTNSNTSGNFQLSTLSVKDWTEVSTVTVSLTPQLELPMDLTYNYATGEVLLITNDMSGMLVGQPFRMNVYRLDVATGDIELVVAIDNNIFGVAAISPNGVLYGVTIATTAPFPAGRFMSVDLATGTTTLIANTGFIPNHAQSLAFDRPSGKLFWARLTGANPTASVLHEINIVTGELTTRGDIANVRQIVGMFSDVIAVGATPADGASEVAITASPSVTFNNNIAAADLSTINISPSVNNVSASINNNVLTIAHDGFNWNTTYTVTVPKEAIQYLQYDIVWTFQTMLNPILCNPPSQLRVDSIAPYTALLGWQENGGATRWNLKYGASGFDVATEGTLVSGIDSLFFLLEGLSASTSYDFYVQADCLGGETSGWSVVHTFATPKDCDSPITIFPWIEDFEGEMFPPECWNSFSFSGEKNWERFSGTFAGTTINAAAHNFTFNQEEISWLVMPRFNIPTGEDAYILRFRNFNDYPEEYGPLGSRPNDYYGYNGVWISTGSPNPADGDFIEAWTPRSVRAEWGEEKVNLSDHYAGKDIYIAFLFKGRNSHVWYIRDVSIDTYDYKDIQAISIDQPASGGPNLSDAADVTITLFNNGSRPLTNTPVTLIINGQTVAQEIIEGPIFSLTYFSYTFDHKVDFSALGTYTIEVEVELEGDMEPENNRTEKSIFSTSNENITLYGFSVFSFPIPDNRFVSFNTNSVGNPVTPLGEVTRGYTALAGEYLNGYFYMFFEGTNDFIIINNDTIPTNRSFIKFDARTWQELERHPAPFSVNEMTFDHSTQTMYAVGMRSATESYLFTVNLSTGALSIIAPINATVLGLAADLDGTLFAVTNTGDFGTVDKVTGYFQVIRNTTYVYAQFLQSMGFDHNTGRLFWSLAGEGPNSGVLYGGLVELDKTTGVPFFYGRIGSIHTIIVGLHTSYVGSTNIPNIEAEEMNITVYPNPVEAGQLLHINLPEHITEANVNIYNTTGVLVHQQRGTQSIIAPKQIGLYILEVQLPDGRRKVQRVIVR